MKKKIVLNISRSRWTYQNVFFTPLCNSSNICQKNNLFKCLTTKFFVNCHENIEWRVLQNKKPKKIFGLFQKVSLPRWPCCQQCLWSWCKTCNEAKHYFSLSNKEKFPIHQRPQRSRPFFQRTSARCQPWYNGSEGEKNLLF